MKHEVLSIVNVGKNNYKERFHVIN